MELTYETERLSLRILNESNSKMVLDFLWRNKEIFEPYETVKSGDYYTQEYQRKTLSTEFRQIAHFNYMRFYVFKKNYPDTIIGTVSFGNFLGEPYHSCALGYKFDLLFQHNGYAAEAIEKAVEVVFNEMNIHRIEAFIMPINQPSIRLINRLAFTFEGMSKELIRVNGEWKDHYRYARVIKKSDNK